MNRVLLSATSSNVGKTSITIGLIEAMKRRNKQVASFKSGPDYIDPMFHKEALGVDSGNLDLYLMGEDYVKELLMTGSQKVDISIIEGAMGFYDGIATSSEASSYDLARITETPVILIASAAGMGRSFGAMIRGFLDFAPDNQIKGIILNQTKPMLKSYYQKILAEFTDIPILGCIPKLEGVELESRHLGLVTAQEIEGLSTMISTVADAIEKYVDLDRLWEISTSKEISFQKDIRKPMGKVRVAIARDKAFCFYYQDSLKALEDLGVEWVEFSLLEDSSLPDNIDGIYIGGGYPELYMKEIEKNKNLLLEIRRKHNEGLVLLCECGGFMTLFDTFEGDRSYDLMGLIQGSTQMTDRLSHFGYVELEAQWDNLLAKKGEKLRGHEFHYSKSSDDGEVFFAKKPLSHRGWPAVHGKENMYAGYPHIHLGSQKTAREYFLQALLKSKEGRK